MALSCPPLQDENHYFIIDYETIIMYYMNKE